MSWNGPEFIIALVAISTVGWIVTSWIRARHGYPVENDWGGTVRREDPETERLQAEVAALRERLVVLERLATDTHQSVALDRQIERLR